MNSNSKISIPIQNISSVEDNIADLRDRIAKNAYSRFKTRGAVPGYELDDWLSAEADVIINSTADLRIENNQVVVEIVAPDTDLSLVFVSITPTELLIFSDPDHAGRQVFQTIRLQQDIDTSEVEAEFVMDKLIVVATIIPNGRYTMDTMRVA